MMSDPEVVVVGVYRLPVTEEVFREQFGILYGYEMSEEQRFEAERHCREQLKSTVLIEALVRNRDSRFKTSDFTQACEDQPKENWQAAWAEAYLTLDGGSLLVERWADPPDKGDLRVAFFMHYWDPSKALCTSYGEVVCPAVEDMPGRLKRLVPYEPVD